MVLQKSVSPPTAGSTLAWVSVPIGGWGRKDSSVCHMLAVLPWAESSTLTCS